MTNIPANANFETSFADIRAGPDVVLLGGHKTNRRTITFIYPMEHSQTRIVALDPTHKGFGYAVFELPFRLVDWGLAHVKGDKHAGAIIQFEALLNRFRPDAVVLEDAEAPGSRRHHRVRRLIAALTRIARERGIAVYTVARTAVLTCFAPVDGRATKHSVAEQLIRAFPELADQLPPPRKPWESEVERMSIFDALALAVTYASG